MSGLLVPTTKDQVEGYKFLQRRAEYGAVMGDIRLLHDPLGGRRKALTCGIFAAVLIGIGAVGLSVLSPQKNPGDAPLVRTESGVLYVRDASGAVSQVTNLSSARLLLGAAENPQPIATSVLAHMQQSVPRGIPFAPDTVSSLAEQREQATLVEDSPDFGWALCEDPLRHVVTIVGRPLGEESDSGLRDGRGNPSGIPAVVVSDAEHEWVMTSSERRSIDPADGELISSALSSSGEVISPIIVSDALLNTVPEGRHISALSEKDSMNILNPYMDENNDSAVCISPSKSIRVVSGAYLADQGGVMVAEGIRYIPPDVSGAVGVATDTGWYVIGENGVRYHVSHEADRKALGIEYPVSVPWEIISVLPPGSELSYEAADRTWQESTASDDPSHDDDEQTTS